MPVDPVGVAVMAIGGAVTYALANQQQIAELFGRLGEWVPGKSGGVKEQLADLTSHVEDQDKAIAFLLGECESLHSEARDLVRRVRAQRAWLIGVGAVAVVSLLIAVFH